MNEGRHFHSRILLFGEYSLMMGSSALGIPYKSYKARVSTGGALKMKGSQELWSNNILKQFYQGHLLNEAGLHAVLNMERLGRDIENGLCIISDIPMQSGLGSSGALCAAVYGHYAFDPLIPRAGQANCNWRSLRNTFIIMESWFHGRSSGFDALISYLGQPILLDGNGGITRVSIPRDKKAVASVFLVDTGLKAATAGLVRDVLLEFSGENCPTVQGDTLLSLTDRCVNALLAGERPGFGTAMKELSAFQLRNMSRLIPVNMREIWAEGLRNDSFYLKLCGSGGGGFMLGFSNDPVTALEYLGSEGLETINVEQKHQYYDSNVD